MAFAANAQTITDELRQKKDGQGTVVVNQSAEVERLVNGPVVDTHTGGVVTTAVANNGTPAGKTPAGSNTASANKTTPTTPATATTAGAAAAAGKTNTPAAPATAGKANTPAAHAPATSSETAEAEAPAVNMNKKIMRHSYKTTGYRIQVYSGGNKREDRAKCDQIAQRVKARFPDLPIYVHFYSPSWKCRVGNFTNMGEAQSVLSQIKGMGYKQACLVKGTISVQY